MTRSKKQTNRRIDIDNLRRRVSEEQVTSQQHVSAKPTALGPLARLVANQLRRETHSPTIILGLIAIAEFVCLTISAIAWIYFFVPELGANSIAAAAVGLGFAATASLALNLSKAYQLQVIRLPNLLTARLFTVMLIATVTTGILIEGFSLSANFNWSLLTVLFFMSAFVANTLRHGVARAIRRWGRNGFMERRAVIVGGGSSAKDVIRALELQQNGDIRICGIFDDRNGDRSPNIVAGYPKLGTFAELVEFVRETKLDMLIIALPVTAEARILQLLRKLWILPVDIRIASHSSDLRFRPRSYNARSEMPMLDVFQKPIADWDSVSKRIFDIIFAIIALSLTWPIMLAAAIAVKATSKGPVLFVQKRHGFNNDTIDVLKFRSMYVEASDPTAKKAVTKNDPRVTPVGRFIRKTSIDELPQLFNVLRGDLSLVGPRPHAIHAQSGAIKYDEVVEHYFARHKVKPGVTGWAQINGLRGEIDNGDKIKNRTAYDLYYIENWSLWLDFKILVKTPISLLRSGNAY